MKAIKILLVVPVIVLFAAACTPNFPTTQPESAPVEPAATEPVSEPPAATEPLGEPEAAAPTDAAPTEAAPTEAVPPADTPAAPTDVPVEVVEECPFSPDLHATNPATVSLASGEVQLVEFFAFW